MAPEQEVERTNIYFFQYLILQCLNQYAVDWLGFFTSQFSCGSKAHSQSIHLFLVGLPVTDWAGWILAEGHNSSSADVNTPISPTLS